MFSKKFLTSVALSALCIAGSTALVSGVALAQETTSAVRGEVRAAGGAPLSGAQVTVTHGPTGSVSEEGSDASGVFDLRGLRVGGPYTIEVIAEGYQGQRYDDVYLEVGQAFRLSVDLDSSDDEIVVTGTRLADRTVTTSPAPIDVLRGADLRASGYFETNQILRQLTPSFAWATPTTPDGNTHIRSASLRGLSPDSTLVLVNGQRIHSSAWINTSGTIGKGAAPTDLNQIPAAAIGRIEVLRDGAAAQYGADAIAGVINIILREDSGWSAAASYGATEDGGGDTYDGFLHGGFGALPTSWLGTEEDEPLERGKSVDSRPTALILGRLDDTPWKGHHRLIDAWPAVVEAIPAARLLIVGGGPGLPAARERAQASAARDSIELRGFVPEAEIETVWNRASVLAMPSTEEGFGLVFVEAMRRGVPILTSTQDAGAEVGVDQLVFGMPNNLTHDEATECLELFGDKVIPNWDPDPVHRTTRMRQTAKPKYGPFEHEPPAIETIYTQGLA